VVGTAEAWAEAAGEKVVTRDEIVAVRKESTVRA